MKRKIINNINDFEVGALYKIHSKANVIDEGMKFFNLSEDEGIKFFNHLCDYVVQVDDFVLCLEKTESVTFLLPNGCVGKISSANLIANLYFGLGLVKMKTRNKKKEASHA